MGNTIQKDNHSGEERSPRSPRDAHDRTGSEPEVVRAVKKAMQPINPRLREGCNGILNLSNLSLTQMPSMVSRQAVRKELIEIDFSCNKLKSVEECPDFPKLLRLSLWGNNMKELPDLSEHMPNLELLNIGHNHLEDLTWKQAKALKTLCMEANALEEISEQFLAMTSLTGLDLKMNRISSVPEGISSLTNLVSLDLGANRLNQLPVSLKLLSRLKNLSFSNNALTSIDDESLKRMSMLETLLLDDNQLSELPARLGGLRNLHTLKASDNCITQVPPSLGEISRLQILDLANNQLSELPSEMGRLVLLKKLTLSGNRLSSIPDCVLECTSLEVLRLSNNRIAHLPASMATLGCLQRLDLSFNVLETLSDGIGEITRLVDLNLTCNRLEEYPRVLVDMVQLQCVRVCNNRISRIPVYSGKAEDSKSNLHLWVTANRLKQSPLSSFLPVAKRLRTLCLFSGTELDVDDNDIAVLQKCVNLERLSIYLSESSCIKIMEGLAKHPSLKRIYVGTSFLALDKIPRELEESSTIEEVDLLRSKKCPHILQEFHLRPTSKRPLGVYQITGMAGHNIEDAVCIGMIAAPPALQMVCKTAHKPAKRSKSEPVKAISHPSVGGQSSKLKYVGPESSSVIEFAAVFDGHGGDEVAVEAQRALADALYVSFHNFFDAGENKVEAIEEETETKIKAALAEAFMILNGNIREEMDKQEEIRKEKESRSPRYRGGSRIRQNEGMKRVGATAAVLLRVGPLLVAGNAGDSRVVLGVVREGSQELETVAMTVDHKPHLPQEVVRIRGVDGLILHGGGGYRVTNVEKGGRHTAVAVARSLGDFFLAPAISAEPHISTFNLDDCVSCFAILACDGLWDVCSDEQATQILAASIQHRKNAASGTKNKGESKGRRRGKGKNSARSSSRGSDFEGIRAKPSDMRKTAANLCHLAYGMGSGDDISAIVAQIK